MLLRSLICGVIALGCVACTVPLVSGNPETKQSEDLMGFKYNADCPIGEPVSNLLANGSLDRRVWENVFRNKKGDEFVEEFLGDWKRGDKYTVLRAHCFHSPGDRESFAIKVMTPRLGAVELMAEIGEEGMIAFDFLILSRVIFEI